MQAELEKGQVQAKRKERLPVWAEDYLEGQNTLEEQQYTYVNQKKLRWGYTTGTCGAAAALAAASLLFEEEELANVRIETPKGIFVPIEITQSWQENGVACCGVVKDSGDDPDATNGATVLVSITQNLDLAFQNESAKKWSGEGEQEGQAKGEGSLDGKWYSYEPEEEDGDHSEFALHLKGGKGIGIVTREGLSCPVGMWAINPVPRDMIFGQVASVCKRRKVSGPVYITIEIPEGEALAEKTMNPQLGIIGGLSILGTSGVVEPMSEHALLETIRLEISQKASEGIRNLLAVPGNYGADFVSRYMGLSLEHGIKCSNFIGNTIDMAVEAGMEGLLFVGHAGKLLKLAAGVMNTHSSVADGRMECLAAYGAAQGASQEMAQAILSCVTVEEGLKILEDAGLLDSVMEMVMERISAHLKCRAGSGLLIEAVLFTNERGILGTTPGAIALLGKLADG